MNMHVSFSLADDVGRITVECGGDLIVQGEVRDDIRVAYSQGDSQPQLEPADAGVRLVIYGDAQVQLPNDVPLVIAKSGGDLVINNVQADVRVASSPDDTALQSCGDVTFNNVHGDLAAHHVGTLNGTSVHGDCAVKHAGRVSVDKINGDFAVNHSAEIVVTTVHGDCAINHVGGEIRIDTVDGDAVVNNTSGSVHIDHAGGDVIFRGVVSAGDSVRIRAGGDMTMNLSGPVSVHTLTGRKFPGWDEIRAQPASDGGGGGAEVLVAAAGELLFTGEGEMRIPGFSLLEKMSIPTPPTPPMPPSPTVETPEINPMHEEAPASSGASEDETMKVLRMVQEGKISPEEGDMLLDALSK